jgi:hypothetical protein
LDFELKPQEANVTTPLQEQYEGALRDNAAMSALIGDLIYNGIERGYTRGSRVWADQVRVSARAAGLSEADEDVLIDADLD